MNIKTINNMEILINYLYILTFFYVICNKTHHLRRDG